MRIIVFSDTHGKTGALFDVVEMHLKSADMFIHLGDGEQEADMLKSVYPYIDLRYLRGNCDYNSAAPDILTIEADFGVKIVASHGHTLGVKYGLEMLIDKAEQKGAKIALYGHTHQRYSSYENGLYIMNPGSLSQPRDFFPPSYGIIDITAKGIVTNIAEYNG